MVSNSHAPDYGVPVGTFTVIEYHLDSYATTFGTNRHTYLHSGGGTPDSFFDAALECYGAYTSNEQMYSWYQQQYDAREAVATSIKIDLGAEQVGGQTFRVQARVSMDATGTAETVRIRLLQVLDHWPSGYSYARNCFVQTATTEDIALTPGGDSVLIERDFALTDTTYFPCWTNRSNVRFIAWVQQVTGHEIYQAADIGNPFPVLYPRGDMNCDGLVNNQDIDGFILALLQPAKYTAQYPTCNLLQGDFFVDGVVNNQDIDGFILRLFGS